MSCARCQRLHLKCDNARPSCGECSKRGRDGAAGCQYARHDPVATVGSAGPSLVSMEAEGAKIERKMSLGSDVSPQSAESGGVVGIEESFRSVQMDVAEAEQENEQSASSSSAFAMEAHTTAMDSQVQRRNDEQLEGHDHQPRYPRYNDAGPKAGPVEESGDALTAGSRSVIQSLFTDAPGAQQLTEKSLHTDGGGGRKTLRAISSGEDSASNSEGNGGDDNAGKEENASGDDSSSSQDRHHRHNQHTLHVQRQQNKEQAQRVQERREKKHELEQHHQAMIQQRVEQQMTDQQGKEVVDESPSNGQQPEQQQHQTQQYMSEASPSTVTPNNNINIVNINNIKSSCNTSININSGINNFNIRSRFHNMKAITTNNNTNVGNFNNISNSRIINIYRWSSSSSVSINNNPQPTCINLSNNNRVNIITIMSTTTKYPLLHWEDSHLLRHQHQPLRNQLLLRHPKNPFQSQLKQWRNHQSLNPPQQTQPQKRVSQAAGLATKKSPKAGGGGDEMSGAAEIVTTSVTIAHQSAEKSRVSADLRGKPPVPAAVAAPSSTPAHPTIDTTPIADPKPSKTSFSNLLPTGSVPSPAEGSTLSGSFVPSPSHHLRAFSNVLEEGWTPSPVPDGDFSTPKHVHQRQQRGGSGSSNRNSSSRGVAAAAVDAKGVTVNVTYAEMLKAGLLGGGLQSGSRNLGKNE
ncbi:hypothetical protein HDU78_009540 [Chytriomyces hyalinus]|nr:hypothetical protein HDU78_009540 [Chytriomyces hyalinus]